MVKKIQNKRITFKTILIGDSASIIETFQLLENMSRSAGHEIVGYNYRMTNMQAAVRLAQLENLSLIHISDHTRRYAIE